MRRVLLLGMILLGVGTAIFVAQDALGAAAQRAERDSSVDQDSLGMFAPEAPLASADLSLSKIDTPDPIGIGNQLTYQITVLNTGPDNATNVVLTDTLPAGVGLVSVVPSQGNCSGTTTIVCNLANLASGNSATVTILVSADAAGTLTNTAEVSSDDADPYLTDNTAVATTEVLTGPDVGLSKSDSPDPVFVGDNITYALTVTNHGPGKAKGIVLTDMLPSEVSLVSATPAQGNCSGTATVVCALGDLNNRQSTQVTIVVTANAPGGITNTAEIATSTYDPTPGNDIASTETTVRAEYDLGIAKSDSPDPVALGDNLTYTIQVTNYGTSTATGVVMTDNLPGGVSYVSATPSQGSCSGSGPVVCNLGSIASGNSAQVTLVVKTNSGGLIINTAEVTSPVEESYLGNNTATESTLVEVNSANLSLTKSDSSDPVTAGEFLTYTLTVSNLGPAAATGVSLVDTLPANASFVSSTPGAPTCAHASGSVTCNIGSLAPSVSSQVKIKVKVSPSATGSLNNQATVTASTHDPQLGNNTASANTSVAPKADLSLNKTDSPDPVSPGGTLTYQLTVTNLGPSDAMEVTLMDNLPADVTFSSSVPAGPTCSHASDTLSCNLGNLPVGDSTGVTIMVQVSPSAISPLINQATVSSITSDPVGGNNQASTTTSLNQSSGADLEVTKADSPDPVAAGSSLTYTLTVHNYGPENAVNVHLVDNLPTGVSFKSVTPPSPVCEVAGNIVECGLGNLLAGQETVVIIVVDVNPATIGNLVNQASVSADTSDPVLGNNTDQETTTALLDTIPPVVNWVSPVGNEGTYAVTRSPVPLQVTATDNMGVFKVRFYRLDEIGNPVEIGEDKTAPYQWGLNPGVLHMGLNQVFAMAYDNWGNPSEPEFIWLLKREVYLPLIAR